MKWIEVPPLLEAIVLCTREFFFGEEWKHFYLSVWADRDGYTVYACLKTPEGHLVGQDQYSFERVPPLHLSPCLREHLLSKHVLYQRFVLQRCSDVEPDEDASVRQALTSFPVKAIVADSFFRLR